MYGQQRNANQPCNYTCCFCCSYNYDAVCVYKTAMTMDIILCILASLSDASNSYNTTDLRLFALLNILFIVAQIALAIYAIYNLCNFDKFRSASVLKVKSDIYMRVRMWFIIYIGVMAIVLGAVYTIVAKNYAIEHWNEVKYDGQEDSDRDDVSNMIGAVTFLVTVIPVIVEILVFLGYRPSFNDAVLRLCPGGVGKGARPTGVGMGGFPNVPAYPMVYAGSQPVMIDGQSTNPFMPNQELQPITRGNTEYAQQPQYAFQPQYAQNNADLPIGFTEVNMNLKEQGAKQD